MTGYTKLFESLVTSTIWQRGLATKVVWITMLALKNRDHIVEASVPGLAHVAGVSVEECRIAIADFLGPDPDSRSKEYDGRRIEVVDGGWRILNGDKYRDKMSRDDIREANARRMREYRDKKTGKLCSGGMSLGERNAMTVAREEGLKEEGGGNHE
jgi:hypothetical protein